MGTAPMEDDLFKRSGVDHETGRRVYQSVFDDLMDALREDPNDETYEAAVTARETQPAPRDPVLERLFYESLRRRPKSK